MWWFIAGLIIIILIFLCYSRLYIHFNLVYTETNKIITIRVLFYQIQLFKRIIHLPTDLDDEWKSGDTDPLTSINSGLKREIKKRKKYKNLARFLLSCLSFLELKWHTHIGTGRAHTTGIGIGGLWSIKGMLIGVLTNLSDVPCDPIISIIPHFEQKVFTTEIHFIASIRLEKMISFLFKLGRGPKENKKI